MTYELRERRNNGIPAYYYWSEDEDQEVSEADTINDPDYTRTSTRRKGRGRNPTPESVERRSQRRKTSASTSSREQQPQIEEKTILSWLINNGEIRENERVKCGVKKKGVVRNEGILCKCCNTIMNVSKFEIHGRNLSERPYESIIVIRTNSSLLKHLIRILNNEDRSSSRQYNIVAPRPGAEDNNDVVCLICAKGGTLICCESCPSTFHKECTDMQEIPAGGCYCIYCKCKYCGETFHNENKLTCVQCAKAFHWQCYGTRENLDLNDAAMGLFCSSACKEVTKKLRSMIGTKNLIKDEYTWSLIQRMEADEIEDDHKRIECNSKVALAFEVLNECFNSSIDTYTRINMLESMVNNKGSNFERMNFSNSYTLILEKNDAIISALTFRMHDNGLAEMPYATTWFKYRQRGMFTMLFEALTYVLSCIGAKHMLIPAINEVVPMWIGKYGFYPIDNGMKQKLQNYSTLMFPIGTTRLQKNLQQPLQP